VATKYPRKIIEDVYNFQRYTTAVSRPLKAYVIFQLWASLGFLIFMFYNFSAIGSGGLLTFGGFVFVGIYGYTSLMDRMNYGAWIESGRALAGLFWIYFQGDWFGIDSHLSFGSYWVALYFCITFVGGIYFSWSESGPREARVKSGY
jgi:hypothetical protein